MSDSFSIVVATFGDSSWIDLAQSRAIPSARAQDVPVIHEHRDTLHEARNAGLARVETSHVIHLDADDELETGYVEAMAAAWGDLRAPRVRYVRRRRVFPPGFPAVAGHTHDCTGDCLPEGNWLVIGTAVRADLLRDVGGWRDFAWSEDWDGWVRCWLAGATVERVPDAIYRAHVRADSRNRAPDRAFKLAVHEQIHRANFPEQYEEAA